MCYRQDSIKTEAAVGERHSALKRQQRKKNPASSVLSSPTFTFFPLRAFLFQICHSFLSTHSLKPLRLS